MTRFTKKALKEQDPIVAGFIQYLEQNGFDVSKANPVSEAKPRTKEAFVGQAKLVKDLQVHYDLSRAKRFEESELAIASYKLRGKANLRNLMLTWGHLNKQPSVTKFVGDKDSKTLKRTWWSKHDNK